MALALTPVGASFRHTVVVAAQFQRGLVATLLAAIGTGAVFAMRPPSWFAPSSTNITTYAARQIT
jgi:hypothetical protein